MARKRKSLKFLNILFIILGVILIAWGVNFFLGDRNQAEGEEEIEEPSNIVEEIPEDQEDQEDLEQQEQTEKEIKSVKISAAGDIMFHMSQINGGYDENTDTYNFKPFFEEIKPFIEEADISIANFEGTTAGLENGNVYKAWPVFNVPDETLDAVKYAGFDILSTVNNHSIDMGKDGIIRTIEQIEKRNMMKVGTRKSPDEERVLIIEENDIKIAVIAYTYGCNGLEQYLTPEELDYMVNIIDEEKINEDIIYSKENDTDFIIAFMHWGGEYQRDPSLPQKDLADKMLSMGVDVILGSHPHVIQDSKTLEYDGEKKFIAYSMGNFISNQRYETLAHEYPNLNMYYTEDGVIVNLELEKDFETEEAYIKNIDFVPTWVNRIKVDGRYDYDILPIRNYLENNEVSEELKERMENSYTNTMNKMNTNLN
jgi:poly-gamma-glutamate synthesis protein (capsule biosynthesis protein)